MREFHLGDEVFRALKHVWATLEPLGHPAAVMGGIAVSYWQHIRTTRDVDLLLQIDVSKLDDLLQSLRVCNYPDINLACPPEQAKSCTGP